VTRRVQWLLVAVVALAAGAAGFAYNGWRTGPTAAATDAGAALQRTKLPDLDGRVQSLDAWHGKVVVINFWATWCGPCREEIPLLVKLQEKYGPRGFQLVGVAIDQPEKVRPYAAEMGMNFPILIGGAEAIELTRTLGNRAGVLPFTVVLDRQGRIVDRTIGIVKEARLEPQLLSLF